MPGDIANLDALLSGRSDYGLHVLSAAKVIALPCDRLLALVAQHTGIARAVMQVAFQENAILSQWALCLGRHTARQRLAHLLCELAVRVACDAPDAACFELPLTQEQLADALGLTAVHVNRTMQHLRNAGLIEAANRTVSILDMVRLRNLAEFDPAYLHIGAAASPACDARSGANTEH